MKVLIVFLCAILSLTTVNATLDLREYNEWNVLELVAPVIPENPVIICGGIHRGEHVAQMYNRWPKGQLYVFEPNPDVLKAFTPLLGWFPKLKIFPYALSSVSGTFPFYLNSKKDNPFAGSLLKPLQDWLWYYGDTIHWVQTKNLGQWAEENQIHAIDFLWLDIGGSELEVLRSSESFIFSTTAIFLETHMSVFREGTGLYNEVKQLLEMLGFEEIKHWWIQGFHGRALFIKKGLLS